MPVPRRGVLAEEAAEVEVLYANLEKLKSLSKKIQGSMSRLEVSGRTVQDAIGPVYGNTQRLQVMNTNVERVLEAIERAREPLDMTKREERILRSRPERVGLADYMSSIDRTNQALRELKASNLRSNQQAISELSSLLSVGTQSLEDVFRDLCRRDSQPIEPLGYIMKGSDFPRLAQQKTAQLRTINAQIYNYISQTSPGDLTPSARVYAQERGQYITLSLSNLAQASLSTARKVAGQDSNAIYKQGSNGVSSYASGMQGMYTAEYDNICQIFSREEWGQVLNTTCQSSLAVFANTLRDLDAHIKANLITDCYLAYEIIEVVSNTSYRLEDRTGELKQSMAEALIPVRDTAKSSLSILLSDIRSRIQQLSSLPVDGSAVPITSEVMQRLQTMTSYLPPLTSIMRSLGDGGWSAPNNSTSNSSIPTVKSFDVGADGKQLFSHYSNDTIDSLLSNLESRAKTMLRGKSVQGVFLANNIALIERMIRSSELQPLLGSSQKLDAWRKKSSSLYTDAWRDTSIQLLDTINTKNTRPPSMGQGVNSADVLKALNSKEKDAIKEKFRSFNMSFDDLVAKHKSFKMEPEVRRMLGRDVQAMIEPLYARFWERYHEVDKGKGKYVKYDKGQLSSILASLS